MRNRSLVSLCTLGLVLTLLLPAAALAAPKITSVSPKRAQVGDTLTLRGSGFKPGAGKNTVVFKTGDLYASAKAYFATRRTLKVRIPEKLEAYMRRRGSDVLATRFQVRVRARGSRYTPRSDSPVIEPAPEDAQRTPAQSPTAGGGALATDTTPDGDCDLDGATNGVDSDDDNDLLDDATETGFAVYKTDPCQADSDGDGVEDGYEYRSALDLNQGTNVAPIPYPGKKPYPNPLFSDGSTDYDGDGLTLADEYAAWIRYGVRALGSLNYSDGDQTTGPAVSDAGAPPYADFNDSPANELSDDEKDIDGDGLTNWDESHGRLTYGWWKAAYETERDYYLVPFAELDFLDPDTDGDGVTDGADDQDHDDGTGDDLTNIGEVGRQYSFANGQQLRVNPYNPCLPNPSSPTCTRHPPFDDAPAPFDASSDANFPAFPAPYSWAF